MSSLTAALEKLDQAIQKLDQAIDTRVGGLEKQQSDLFSQLEGERDRNKTIAKELDDIIAQLETSLNTQTASVR